MKYSSIFILSAILLSCSSTSDNNQKSTKENIEEETEITEVEAKPEPTLKISLNDQSSFPLTKLDVVKEYDSSEFKELTSIITDKISPESLKSAKVIYSVPERYYIEIKTNKAIFISVHDRSSKQLSIGKIFEIENNLDYGKYYLITTNNIRVHKVYKDKSEDYSHYRINSDGQITEVVKPGNVLDYFAILPENYLNQYINGEIRLFPNLKSGSDWYHTYISEEIKQVVDIKNGYLSLISTMAMFNSDAGPFFVLTNSAGGTCETFLYHYFLKYNAGKEEFIQIPDDEILPEIDKYELYIYPDSIKKYFPENRISLKLIPPQYGTIMTVEPYIDECGIEDPKMLDLISRKNPASLQWNRANSRFIKLEHTHNE